MKRNIKIALMTLLTLPLMWSCEEDVITVLDDVQMEQAVISSTQTLVVLEADSMDEVITLTWEPVDWQRDVPVTYTLQFTTADDQETWARAVETEVGEDVLTQTFTGEDFNDILIDRLGLAPASSGQIVVRIKAYVDRAVYSPLTSLTATGYKPTIIYPSLRIAGDYQGWDLNTADLIVSKSKNDIYEGYIYLPEGSGLEFKVYDEVDGGNEYGPADITTISTSAGNFTVAEAGYYLVAIDLNTNNYLVAKTQWGAIGGATPGGWDTDTDLAYDEVSETWSATMELTAGESFKFRANDAWVYDFGIDEDGALIYANHPWKPYVDQMQLSVPTSGTYLVTLDLHDPADYTYSIVAQ